MRGRLGWATLVGALVALSLWPTARAEVQAHAFVVIVHPGVPERSIKRELLAQMYLKKVTRWSDQELVKPVDLRFTTPVRREFSEHVLQRSLETVRIYWQQRIFSGRDLPPPELPSDELVLEYVARTRGAVGYVSAQAKLDNVKVLNVR
jgi:ABC-type phosphate transport system substrate-binding protein